MDAAFRHNTYIIALPQLPPLTPSFSLGADKVLQGSHFKTFAFYLSIPPFMSGHESCINFDNEIPARKKPSCSCKWRLLPLSLIKKKKEEKEEKKRTHQQEQKTKPPPHPTPAKKRNNPPPRRKANKQTNNNKRIKKLNNTTARGTLYNFFKGVPLHKFTPAESEHYFHPKQTI